MVGLTFIFPAVDSVKCHSCFYVRMHLGCSVIKLMINDNTSVWQKGNHGDTTLNKHYIPTGTERKREREQGKERGGRGRCFSVRFIVTDVMCR